MGRLGNRKGRKDGRVDVVSAPYGGDLRDEDRARWGETERLGLGLGSEDPADRIVLKNAFNGMPSTDQEGRRDRSESVATVESCSSTVRGSRNSPDVSFSTRRWR